MSTASPHNTIKKLGTQLQDCVSSHRHRYYRQLQTLRTDLKKGGDVQEKLLQLSDAIAKSCALRARRQASIPAINYPDLPVSEKQQEIADLIRQNQVVIVCGETGSGKTTQLPKICLSIGRGTGGYIGHTQPRRIAARTVADRIASELGEQIGHSVGYKVRFHDKTRPESLVKLMTDGILLAESQNDPYLSQYDTLIIDEAHERSLNIDFLLGYLKLLLPKRKDLKLIITSATIDPERFSRHFDNAPIINVSGRTYPVEIRYRPIQQNEEDDETSNDLQQAILDSVDELYRDMPGDILIFLSGEKEIKETAESLRKHHPAKCEILPLYSKLSSSDQDKVFKPKGQRRIVLATNVAETSLTVPGIRSVIDAGHARISRYSHRSKIQRLPIEKISQASANQRAGRCGRVAEGICIRLYSEDDYLARPEFTEPEILRTNLASVILQMTTLKLGHIEKFPFVEPPEHKMIRDGIKVLHEINALDNNEKLTTTGRQLAKLPIDPKLARMLLAADKLQCLSEVAIIVSGLSIQDPREKPSEKLQQAESKHLAFRADDSDFLSFLNLWQAFEEKKKHVSNNQLRKWCKEQYLSYMRMREWMDVHSQVMQVIKGELQLKPNIAPSGYAEIHQALLPGLLSNIGFKHEQYEYLGARNLKFFIFPGSGQHKVRPKWLMAAEQVETSKVYARNVAKIEPEWIEASAQHLIKRNYYDPHWEKKAARCAVYERTMLYGLTLHAKRKVPYERIDPVAARDIFIRSALVNQDYYSNAPFYQANAKLLEEVGYIQHKGRRVDLVEDEEWLYQFYNKRIPAEVVNGITLDQWRKKAEKIDPELLFLTREDLTREQEHSVNERDFPDQLQLGKLQIRLQYRFEPGHDEDGVTAIIPVHQLNQITEQAFHWLVPGLFEEKITALIKGLPKTLRKHFVPVPQTVQQCLETEPEPVGSLYEWLGKRLRQISGESIPLNAWNTDALPNHLRMNFRVIDDKDKLLEYGRSLKTLQSRFTHQAGDSFEQLTADEFNYTGCIQWAFDDLPETWQFEQKGHKFVGYPAIIDEGDAVAVRIIETRSKAQLLHRLGVLRLLQLYCRKDCKYLLKQIRNAADIELLYNQLTKHPLINLDEYQSTTLKEAIVCVVFSAVFNNAEQVRTQQQFEALLAEKRGELTNTAMRVIPLINDIFQRYQQVKKLLTALPANDAVRMDIEQQLQNLLYKNCLQCIPYNQLQHFPRYLQAAEYRLQKFNQDRGKDMQKMQELQRFSKRYGDDIIKRKKTELVQPELENFRWALEEFRVSLFAQQLKTPYPVSAKRLEKMW